MQFICLIQITFNPLLEIYYWENRNVNFSGKNFAYQQRGTALSACLPLQLLQFNRMGKKAAAACQH